MTWKATGLPTVRQQRRRWVVRVDGIDTETGNHRPRQLGTYASQRAARNASSNAIESGRERVERESIGELVQQWADSRTDVSPNQRQQYRWAARHIQRGIGAIAVERLGRDDIDSGVGMSRQLNVDLQLARRRIETG